MGKVGSFKRLSRVALLVGIAAALVGVPLAASANPDVSGFELDGNAASGGASDWNSLGSPLDFTGFIDDGAGDSDIGYGTGSNKDIDDVGTWSWLQDDVTPNKDDIVSAYASVYAEQGNLILYFGQTRLLDKNGDANVGFWFLQNEASLNADGSFSGSHADGDILVQSEFTNGGSVSGVHIFKWQGGALTLVSNQAQCTGGKLGTADACAIVNTGTISTDWAGSVTAPYFFEGGLNLTALFPQGTPCFSTFLTNTRTSQSESAELKDFALGDIDTCGSITIKKVTTPSGGGPFSFTTSGTGLSDFSLSGGGETSFTKLQPGPYSVTESGLPSAWSLDSLACTTSGPGTSASTPGATANITLGFLGNVVCTYTNKRQPLLTLVKSVVNDNGGTAGPGAWTLSATGSSGSFSGTANTSAVTSQTVAAGVQYTLAESGGPSAYSASGWVCTGGGSFAGPDKITLGLGDDVTCTITNNDQAPSLTLVKQVVNDNGGTAVASDFTLSASGPTSISGAGGASSGSSFSAGTYTLSETSVPGYTPGSWSCTGTGTQSGASITLGLAQSATCTIANNDQPASLTVVKELVNDNGGTKQKTDFSFDVAGPTASQNTFFDADGSVTKVVNAGTYTVTEDQADQGGYATTYSNCAGVVLAPGGSATCTITNNDQAATLIVKKVVVNDNGGTKVASNFSFQVNGGTAVSFEADGQNNLSVNAGTYSVTEPAVDGYTTSYSNCSNLIIPNGGSATCTITNNDQAATLIVKKVVVNDNGGTKVASNFSFQVNGGTAVSFEADGQNNLSVSAGTYSVTEPTVDGYTTSYSNCSNVIVPNGGSATCTITNDDQAATLIVIKHVVNDNGGTAVSGDFQMTVDDAGSNPPSFPGAEGPGTSVPVDPGTYSVSESGPGGYTMSQSADCSGSIALGQTKTCTVTNDDQQANLVVIKHVVNDNGGTAVSGDFQMTVDDAGSNPPSFPGAEAPGTSVPVDPGTYSVSESGPGGYTMSQSADCSGSIALGQTKTCTVTNDDNAPKLTLVKQVVTDSGGTALASAWDLAAAGPTGFDGAGPSVSSGASFDAGSYDLSESGGPAGYDASAWVCSKGQVDGDTVAVSLGDDITCTITNDDRPATLVVKKVVVNDNGGTATADDFSFQVNGGAAQAFQADGQNDLEVAAGTYNVTEPAVAGYTTTYQGCSNIVLALGGTATCVVTNNDVPRGQGSITVSKSANPTTIKEPGGPVTFSVTITNTSADVDVAITNVVDDKFGDLDDSGGNGCFDVPVNLAPGEKVNCTFSKQITGTGGTSHVNVVTVSGTDENGNSLTASDDAKVDITPRLIDLVIVKEASSPTPLNGIVNYSLTVTNKGPDTATNVQLADPAPAGITYLTANPSQGTCSLSPALITCSLGSIAAGQTVTIAITGRATAVGSHTNTATVTGGGGRETNPADNVDSAVTIVPAPLKPPTAKPEPTPEVCLTLTVSPNMIKADGKPDKVRALVTAGKKRVKGVKVSVSGAGVSKAARTNGKGVAVLRINPRKPGIITVTVVESNQKFCGPKRIGVVGVFLPPLTG